MEIPLSFDSKEIAEVSDKRSPEMRGTIKGLTKTPVFGRFSETQQAVLVLHYLAKQTDEQIVEEMGLGTDEDVWDIHDSAIRDLSMLAKHSGVNFLTEEGFVKKLVGYHKQILREIKVFRKKGGDEETARFVESYPSVVMALSEPTDISTRDREEMLKNADGEITAEYIQEKVTKFYSKLK